MLDGDTSWDAFHDVARDALAATIDEPVAELRPQDHLLEDLGLDSFAVLRFVGEIELRLGVIVPPSRAEPTLANLHQLVVARAQR